MCMQLTALLCTTIHWQSHSQEGFTFSASKHFKSVVQHISVDWSYTISPHFSSGKIISIMHKAVIYSVLISDQASQAPCWIWAPFTYLKLYPLLHSAKKAKPQPYCPLCDKTAFEKAGGKINQVNPCKARTTWAQSGAIDTRQPEPKLLSHSCILLGGSSASAGLGSAWAGTWHLISAREHHRSSAAGKWDVV